MKFESYETRRDMIVTHAWEAWTRNGLNLNLDQRAETEKTVRDAANNAYYEGITDIRWLGAAFERLGYDVEIEIAGAMIRLWEDKLDPLEEDV